MKKYCPGKFPERMRWEPRKGVLFIGIALFLLFGGIPWRAAWAGEWQPALLDSFPKKNEAVSIRKAAAIDIDFEGNVYILDRGRHQLLKFSPAGRLLKQIGGFGNAEETFDDPRDVFARTPLDVFVADYNNARVVRYDKNLNFLSQLTSGLDPPFNFERVLSVTVSSQYDLFLLDEFNSRVIKFTRFSEPAVAFGGFDETYGQLLSPTDLALDGSNRLFVADPAQPAIVVFDYLGNYLTRIEHPGFQQPSALFYAADQRLYVADSGTNRILIFEQGRKFAGALDVSSITRQLAGVAVQAAAGRKAGRLFVLGAQRCWVLELHPTP